MGSRLRRELREVLPASIRGLPRAVALEIADDARWDDGWQYSPEHGRRSRATLSDLVRWTAAKNERVIRDALRNLALAGWEFRVPFGKGADGRLLYAVPGRAAEFRVPDFEPPTLVGPAESKETVTTVSPSQAAVAARETVTTAVETVVTAKETVTTASEAVTTGPPSPIPPSSHRYPTSSSPAGVSPDVPAVASDGENGGGGGGPLDESRSIAEEIAGALDYRGKVPDKRQRKTITDRLAAALASGWTVDGLALYLDLGEAAVDSPAAVYAHRLKPGVLPDAETLPAPAAARGGARGRVLTTAEVEALTLADVLGDGRDTAGGGMRERAAREPHRPYTNDAWHRPADPAEAAKIPHCRDPDCDPVSRRRDYDVGNGLKTSTPCAKCHPDMQW